jgi:hypothetical protein
MRDKERPTMAPMTCVLAPPSVRARPLCHDWSLELELWRETDALPPVEYVGALPITTPFTRIGAYDTPRLDAATSPSALPALALFPSPSFSLSDQFATVPVA